MNENFIQISTEDLMYLYETIEKLNEFFHQPMNYQRKEDLENFLGDKNRGAYQATSRCYYDILWNYLPEDIKSKIADS